MWMFLTHDIGEGALGMRVGHLFIVLIHISSPFAQQKSVQKFCIHCLSAEAENFVMMILAMNNT